MPRRFFGFGRNGRNIGSALLPRFPNVDAAAIADELRVDQEGAQRGVRNLPSTEDTGLDRVEQKIVARVESIRNEGLARCDENARVYAQRAMRIDRIGAKIRMNCDTAETNFQAEVVRYSNDLDDSRKAVQDANVTFDQFRQDNRINDSAHEKSVVLQWFAVSLLIVAVESVLNGVFFSKAHEMGLIGGVGNALAISVINVGLASLAGLLTRNFNHILSWRKVVGALAFLVATGLALCFNFVVAHFRDAMTVAAWDQAAGRAVERALAVRLPESMDAWLLALLGLLAAALAGWKTYGADHPYPGYGRVSRKRKEMRDSFHDQQDEAITALTDKRDEFNGNLTATQQEIDDAARANREWAALSGERESFLRQCDQAVGRLLTRYRAANRAERSTPPPAHFDRGYDFSKAPPLDAPGARSPGAELKAEIDDALQRIHAACSKAIDSFRATGKPDGAAP